MLAEMGSNIEKRVIYIPLLDEGTEVYRPTMGVILKEGVYEILKTKDYDPEDEKWKFPPGCIVKCVETLKDNEVILIASEKVRL